MKHYLLVSQCEGKAFRKTRRVASSFMQRFGTGTWQASLSKEALKIMVTELKRVATNDSSISVYDTSLREPVKIIHIGNRNRYTADGKFAFSVHKGVEHSGHNQSGLIRLLSKCCEMAGLLHDIGKGTEQFQNKLNKGVKYDIGLADPVRHEVISVLLSSPMLIAMKDMSSPTDLENWCSEHLQKTLDGYKPAPGKTPFNGSTAIANTLSSKIFGTQKWERPSLIETSINWMILSHHRLPEGRQCEEDGIIPTVNYGGKYGSHYFLKVVEDAESIKDDALSPSKPKFKDKDFINNLTLSARTASGEHIEQPWHSTAWCRAVFDCYRRITRLAEENDHLLPKHALDQNNAWATAIAFMGRTALVYADYIVSSQKVPSGTSRKRGAIYANTVKVDNVNQYADTLLVHLLGVGKKAGKFCADLFIKPDGMINTLPSLSVDERNILLDGLNARSTDPRYQWQDVLRHTFKSARSNTPFFGTVMGKTGAGKTRGNIMLMHALKEDMRFTCAIGLRSLVNQTYGAYQESFIGLTEDHVALLVGEAPGQPAASHEEPSGTGNDLEEDEKLLFGDYLLTGNTMIESELSDLLDGRKQRAMLANPVQVMTVDHIMPGASLGRSSELKLLMHLMGTDIILDEIDDYPVKSQAALMRMAFISGVFGRSFVVSSATATPIIQKAFFSAWKAGIEHHQKLFLWRESPQEPFAVLVSHVNGNEALRTSLEAFPAACDAFVQKVIEDASEARNVRHRLAIADVSIKNAQDHSDDPHKLYGGGKSLGESQHQQILATIRKAHAAHGVVHNGVRLSSGFVRFNHIRNAQHLALALSLVDDPEIHVVSICYHAAMLSMDRASVEKLLLEINCRKSTKNTSGDFRIFDHPYVKAQIDHAKAIGKNQVIFVLSTTSILEVGRDHDYDWAILEPSSTRSLVQSCGRVWRHRVKTLDAGIDNVWLLPMTVRALISEENQEWKASTKRLWTMHGIEDETFSDKGSIVALKYPLTMWSSKALRKLNVQQSDIPKPGKHERAVLNSEELWATAIEGRAVHAGLCLEIPRTAMSAFMASMELAQQHIHLNGIEDQTEVFTLKYPAGLHYAELPAHRLCENHPKQRMLRDRDEGYSILYDPRYSDMENGYPSTRWRVRDRDGKENPTTFIARLLGVGTLYVPPSLEAYLSVNPAMNSRMATEISLRKNQYEELSNLEYIYGIGLRKIKD